MRHHLLTSLALISTLAAAVLTAGACKRTAFGVGSEDKGRKTSTPRAQGDGKGTDRPTEGDESLPGYFLKLDDVRVDGDKQSGRVRVAAPAGVFVPKSGSPGVILMRVKPDALYAGTEQNGYVAITGNVLKVVAPNADGSFSAEVQDSDWLDDLLVVSADGDASRGEVRVRRSTSVATAFREPFGSGSLRALRYDDVASKGSAEEPGSGNASSPSLEEDTDNAGGGDESSSSGESLDETNESADEG